MVLENIPVIVLELGSTEHTALMILMNVTNHHVRIMQPVATMLEAIHVHVKMDTQAKTVTKILTNVNHLLARMEVRAIIVSFC